MNHSTFYAFAIYLIFLLFLNISYAQKEGNIWYFGNNAGLNFNSGSPVALTNGALSTTEGCSAISDDRGNLLFYTDGIKVWNRNHIQMPNGFGLTGDPSSTQSAVIVSKPGSSNIYYIFTTAAGAGADGLRYSIVDITLQGGLGDVTTKNTLLRTPVTEKLTAVKHGNGCDIWIIAHEWNSDGFLAYLVDSSGVDINPIISNIGATHTGGFFTTNWGGQLKVAPNGSKLACAISGMKIVEFFDFDKTTGLVSNPISFPSIAEGTGKYTYGIEFSPDGTKLYVSLPNGGGIYQYDLTAGSSADIINSVTLIGSSSAFSSAHSLQLGPDGKIYCARFSAQNLGVINDPNALGIACSYVDKGVFLEGRTSSSGLPNFMQSHFRSQFNFTYIKNCVSDSIFFSVTDTTNADSVYWSFGDTASGVNSTATGFNTYHIFSAPGTYHVEITKYGKCISIFHKTIVIYPVPQINLGNDTSLCAKTLLVLNAETPGGTYLWQDGSANSNFTASIPGIYWVEVTNVCGSDIDSIDIENIPLPKVDLGNDTLLCPEQSLLLNVAIPGASYLWQDNSTDPVFTVSSQNIYWVEVISAEGCAQRDSITVNYSILPDVRLGNDTLLCQSEGFLLDVTSPRATYKWQDNSTGSSYHVTDSGFYYVEVTNADGCSDSDSVAIKIKNLKADFEYEEIPCTNQIQFINLSSDTLSSFWDFGDGTTSNENNPVHAYEVNEKFIVVLIINPDSICIDTAQFIIPFEDDAVSDTLFIPNVFTPNGDGKNDYFEIIGINNSCLAINRLTIFNRWGKKVFEAEGNGFKWDGTKDGSTLTAGVYFYMLEGENLKKSGNIILLR